MERVTDEQLRAAHNGLDSGVYKNLLDKREAEQREDTIQATAGCLVKEVNELGFTSATPSECPIEGCAARFDKGRLTVVGKTACLNPSYKPQPKYQ